VLTRDFASSNASLLICPDPPNPGDYAVSVTPQGTSVSWPEATTGHTAQVTVQNIGGCQDTYTFSASASGPVSAVTLDKSSALLSPNQSTIVTATYSVGNPGFGQLTLTATGSLGGAAGAGWYNVTATLPPGTPTVDASPYNLAKQDYGLCANACFAATASRATVPYFSLDAPRQVVLLYNGDRVNPRPFVLVNVSPDLTYGSWPTTYRLQVKVNGAFVRFLNGEDTLTFAYTGTASVRIGGQFDASGYATNVYAMDILVAAVFPSGSVTNDVVTKFVVVNQATSPVARGWSVGGVQRLL